MKYISSLLLLMCLSNLNAQSLELVTISSASAEVESNGYTLSSTFGESITSTFTGASHAFTQGFEQPNASTKNSIDKLVKQGDIKMYPNPANSEITIAGNQPYIVKIYDVHGKLLLNQYHGFDSALQLTISDWPAGIYQVFFFKNDLPVSTSKFIKQ